MENRFSNKEIHVRYSDGTSKTYRDLEAAQEGILDTVTGCDFATTVEMVVDEDGSTLYCEWSLTLKDTP